MEDSKRKSGARIDITSGWFFHRLMVGFLTRFLDWS
jgi:hypothetical protein